MIVWLKNDMFFNTTKKPQFYFVVWIKFHKTPFIFIYLLLVYKYNKYLFLPFRQKCLLINKK